MKKITIILAVILATGILSCSDVKRHPGRIYMPDMAYSRAYETYDPIDTLRKQGINYTAMPVPGTIKRGSIFPFSIQKDKTGDSINYVASRQVLSPLPKLTADSLKEAERLFLVNCAICHGTKLDGNGPIVVSGKYGAQPAILIGLPQYENMPEGQMFYTVTYGKGQMGSYASQLNTEQRWMVIQYIKTQQAASKKATTPVAATGADSTTLK